jgi:phosphatidylglycerol lysyltransferase
MRQGLQILLAAFAFTITYGVLGFFLLDRHFKISFGFWAAVHQTFVMFTQFYDPGMQSLPVTRFGRYFADSIYIVGAVTLSYALIMLLRPVLNRRAASDDERTRAWDIVRAHGRTSMARYTLFDDKHFYFASDNSLISYALENRVALALGGPIGPLDEIPASISAFKLFCAPNDWLPAFFLVIPDYLEIYKAAGFDSLLLGQEAIVDLSKFTLDGSENKTLRNSYNKMVRNGYRYDVVQPPYSPRMLRELDLISNEWLSSRGVTEMRFSLGWFDEAYLNTCPILLVRDREGFIEAFANIVPEFQKNEAVVDLMRHRSQVDSGLMDFLFVSLLTWAKEQNFSSFNLGLSALSGVGEHSDDPVIERALHYIYQNVNRFYNFRGLHAFKEKFHPTWSPRYLIFPGPSNLPAVSISILNANLGRSLLGNFIRRNR